MKVDYKKVALWSVIAVTGAVVIWQVGKAIQRGVQKKKCEAEGGTYDGTAKSCIPAVASGSNSGSSNTTSTSTATPVPKEPPFNWDKKLSKGSPASKELTEAKKLMNEGIRYARNKQVKADPKVSTNPQYWTEVATRIKKIADLSVLDENTEFGSGTDTVVRAIFTYGDITPRQAKTWLSNWKDYINKHT